MKNRINTKNLVHVAPRPNGFALLEVLASLLILTIGLLSVAGLSVNSLKASDTSMHRSTAAREVLAIADAIRSNRQAAVDGLFDAPVGAYSGTGKYATTISTWKQSLKRMPQGDGSILYVAARDSVVISAQWNEERTKGDPAQTFSVEVRI